MKFQNFSNEVVSELLGFLADHEEFNSVKAMGEFSTDEVKSILHQLSKQLREQGLEDMSADKPRYEDLSLSPKALSLISCLSPREEMLLFKSFRVL